MEILIFRLLIPVFILHETNMLVDNVHASKVVYIPSCNNCTNRNCFEVMLIDINGLWAIFTSLNVDETLNILNFWQ